jgi:hypothetical protein
MPSRIDVLSADQDSGAVQVQLTGPQRPPQARLFVLTDGRGRRFVPAQAECYAIAEAAQSPDAPPALPHWRCVMGIPPVYRHAPLTGVSMEWGDRIVSALPGQVKARWAAAGSVSVPATAPPALPPASEAAPAPPESPEASPGPVPPDPPSDGSPSSSALPPAAVDPAEPAPPEPEDTRPE